MTARGRETAKAANTTYFSLSDAQRIAWLRLIRTENVGPATFRDLINHCGSADNALAMLPEIVGRTGKRRYLSIATTDDAERELEQVARHGAMLVGIGEEAYPPMLRLADSPPPLVTIKGNPDVFKGLAVGIVGARNASMAGLTMARRLTRDLGAKGVAVVSGLARGIDCAAHEAALATGTVACLAGGHARPYPPENVDLLQRIEASERGASISEMPFDWEPRARDFPRRNRIIAGLCSGVIVVEAAMRSGSLITARLAGEMGRQVFAVPGSPLDPRSHGTNHLIREGATLVRDAADVLIDLDDRQSLAARSVGAMEEPDTMLGAPPDQSDRQRVLQLLGPTPTPVDDVIDQTGLSPGLVSLVILEASLAGQIERHSGNRVSLVVGEP